MSVFIYCLSHPETGEIRYVGKTTDMKRRLIQHCGYKYKIRICSWIKSLRKIGLKPVIEELERLEEGEDWQSAEKFYIAYFTFLGLRLCNHNEGGAGIGKKTSEQIEKTASKIRGRKRPPMSQEQRDKISKTLTGRKVAEEVRSRMIANKKPFTPEALEKIRQGALGRPKSKETLEKMSLAQKGRKQPEHVLKILRMYAEARKGTKRPLKEETKIKIGNANRGKIRAPASAEARAKISKFHKGRVWSPEHRAKALASLRATLALKKLNKMLTGKSNC